MNHMDREMKRKTIHISMGFLSFLLAIFPRWLSILCILIALFFILVIARPTGWQRSFQAMASRQRDIESGYLHGPLLYILMVLLAVVLYDLRIAATVFCIMAFGDGFANVIGSKFGKHRYHSFQDKSLEGFIAFITFAFIFGTVSFFLVSINPEITSWFAVLEIKTPSEIGLFNVIGAILIVSVISALIELLTSKKINDNISVPLISGILLTVLLKL
jgi:dolichol kinase